jgi:hypothetical protein
MFDSSFLKFLSNGKIWQDIFKAMPKKIPKVWRYKFSLKRLLDFKQDLKF